MNQLTVIAASNLSPTSHARAIDRTADSLPFPVDRILVSNRQPKYEFSGLQVSPPSWMPETKEWSRRDLSRMILKGLRAYFNTDYCLFVQWDGFAINPLLWDELFLEYDYIGAPWENSWNKDHPERRVGCGGFSLRSKKWLEACLTLPEMTDADAPAEDVYSCCHHLDHFTNLGCKVAPLDVAIRFCYEHRIPEYPNHTINDSFGFHWRGHFGEREDLVEPPIE